MHSFRFSLPITLKFWIIGRLCLLLAIGFFAFVEQVSPAQLTPPHITARILLKFRKGVPPAQASNIVVAAGARIVAEIPRIGVLIVRLPLAAQEAVWAQTFRSRPEVEFAELDHIVPPADVIPNDPLYSGEWHLPKIAAPAAWSTTIGSGGIIIAICDTGVDGSHPDLAPKMVSGWNLYDNNLDTSDVYGHGTAVAGTAAAASNNGIGVAGVAWGCQIMPVRVSAPDGWATISTIASGIVWAADHGARVANVSYQVSDYDTITSAADYLQSKGGVVTVAAGNSSAFDATADNTSLLTVSATDSSDVLASWSNTGNNVDLSAPGVSISTTMRGGGYGPWSGTSFSAPLVAGVAALVLSANPDLTALQVQDILKKSADDLGLAGWDPNYGWGRVNAAQAVNLALSVDMTPPTVSITAPVSGSTISGTITIQVTASDNVGVASVDVSVDGAIVGTSSAAPYVFSWDSTTVTNSPHTVTATASDAAGNKASTSISVTVSNGVADTTPPTVSMSFPADGATVSGMVSIQVTASDNVGVSSVSVAVDGSTAGITNTAPYILSWDTTKSANGTHTLTATAADAAGNKSSTTVSVVVNNPDITPPTISISSPAAGSAVSTGNIFVKVDATDNIGVVKVELYVNGVLTDTSNGAPFTTKWYTAKLVRGTYILQCKAYDAAGNIGISAVVTVYK